MADVDNTDNTDAEKAEAFIGSLGDDNKGNELFTGVANAEQLGQKYVDLHKDHEEAKALLPAVPDDVAGYKFEAVEGVDVDETSMGEFRTQAKEMGLSASQFAGVVAFDLARSKGVLAAEKVKADEAIVAMKSEMGDKYDGNLLLAEKVLKTFGSEAIANDVDLGNNPDLFKFLINVGGAISEDSLTGSSASDGDGGEKDAADVMFGDVVAKKK